MSLPEVSVTALMDLTVPAGDNRDNPVSMPDEWVCL